LAQHDQVAALGEMTLADQHVADFDLGQGEVVLIAGVIQLFARQPKVTARMR